MNGAFILGARSLNHAAGTRPSTGGVYAADPWINLDGRLGAPAGPAQYPTALNGFPSVAPPNARVRWPSNQLFVGGVYQQQQWMVAGVDFRVGPPAGQVFKQVGVDALPNGAIIGDVGNRIIWIQNDNTTFDGWDFGAQGTPSYSIDSKGFKNPSVLRSKFLQAQQPIWFRSGSTGGVVSCNVIDANNHSTVFTNQIYVQDLPVTIEYNWIKNGQEDHLGLDGGTGLYRGRYNLLENNSQGAFDTHSDLLQIQSGTINMSLLFNTIINSSQGQNPSQGFWIGSNPGTPEFDAAELAYSSFIRTVGMGQCGIFEPSMLNCIASAHDNYINSADSTFLNNGPFQHEGSATNPGPFAGSAVCHDNVDANNGTKPVTTGWNGTIS